MLAGFAELRRSERAKVGNCSIGYIWQNSKDLRRSGMCQAVKESDNGLRSSWKHCDAGPGPV